MKPTAGELALKIAGFAVVVTLLILALLTLRILLIPLVAASFLAYLFEPGIVVMQQRGTSRGTAFLLLFFACAGSAIILLAIMPAWLRLETVTRSDESVAERLEKQVAELDQWVAQRFPLLQSVDISSKVASRAGHFAESLLEQLPGLMTAFLLNLLLVPFIAYFMVRDGKSLRRRIVSLVPNRYFEMTLIVFHRIDQQIGGYLRGRLIECMLVGVTQALAMGVAALFVPQPQILLISAVCGITNLIPYVGPLMGAGFGALLYLGPYGLPASAVAGLIIATLVAHLVDNLAIAPVVLSNNVDLHPLTVALVLVIGGELLGILGLLIAIPVAASIKVVAQEFYGNYQLQRRLAP